MKRTAFLHIYLDFFFLHFSFCMCFFIFCVSSKVVCCFSALHQHTRWLLSLQLSWAIRSEFTVLYTSFETGKKKTTKYNTTFYQVHAAGSRQHCRNSCVNYIKSTDFWLKYALLFCTRYIYIYISIQCTIPCVITKWAWTPHSSRHTTYTLNVSLSHLWLSNYAEKI